MPPDAVLKQSEQPPKPLCIHFKLSAGCFRTWNAMCYYVAFMKNRLKPYFESERRALRPKDGRSVKNLKQFKLITLHGALSREMQDADVSLKSHYELLLLSLKLLIEAYGPADHVNNV
jgi:hypothetical protein